MFVLNKDENKLDKIESRTFSELGYKERAHLQEWIESNPESLGEEMLFIQKEFGDFKETRERLDLLAIDKQGNLVVIENKLDDSGRDVTWQVLKYASYCSSLSKTQIKDIYQAYLDKKRTGENSESTIVDFLGAGEWNEIILNQVQRIILVSGSFPREVTSTVLWLLTKYNMKIECFKATPYVTQDQVLINIEKIIPVTEVEEYTVKMAEKAQDDQNTQSVLKESHKLRLEFWGLLLAEMNKRSKLFTNISISKDAWLSAGTGLSGVGFNFDIARSYARAHVYISGANAQKNKMIFDKLLEKKEQVDMEIPLMEWDRLDDRKCCRIKLELRDVSLYDKDDWAKMIKFMVESMVNIERVFNPIITKLKKDMKKAENN